MKRRIFWGFCAAFLILPQVDVASALDTAKPAIREELAQPWDDLGRELQELFGRWRDYFLPGGSPEDRPLIAMMLQNREKLGLSDDQVKKLEQLRTDFQKESIRRDADLRVAEMDLTGLLDAQPVDMVKVEAKVREIERLRADSRIARIRVIEKGKEQLTADQRKKLQELMAERGFTRLRPGPER